MCPDSSCHDSSEGSGALEAARAPTAVKCHVTVRIAVARICSLGCPPYLFECLPAASGSILMFGRSW